MRVYEKHKQKVKRYKLSLQLLEEALNSISLGPLPDLPSPLSEKSDAVEITVNLVPAIDDFTNEINKLKRLNFLAWLLTLIILAGIMFNATVAVLSALPALPIYAFWILFGVVAVAAGWTEKQIFYNYVRKFCYQMFFTGPLKSIDLYILKREAKALGKTIEELTLVEAVDILKNSVKERLLKKALIIFAIPLALTAGAGHAALLLHIAIVFASLLHLTLGGAMLICPYTAAILFGLVFSVILFYMIHRAIKKNIFSQIKNKIVDVFKLDHWATASKKEKAIHLVKCMILILATVLIIGLAVLATVLTAGTWLSCSVSFFEYTLHLAHAGISLASQLGIYLTTLLLASNFMFTIENSFTTLQSLTKITAAGIVDSVTQMWHNPIQIVFFPIDLALFTLHAACAAAIAILGSSTIKSFSFPSTLTTITTILSWVVPPVTRGLTDGAPLLANEKKPNKDTPKKPNEKSNDFLQLTVDIVKDTAEYIAKPVKNVWCAFFGSSKEKESHVGNTVTSEAPHLVLLA